MEIPTNSPALFRRKDTSHIPATGKAPEFRLSPTRWAPLAAEEPLKYEDCQCQHSAWPQLPWKIMRWKVYLPLSWIGPTLAPAAESKEEAKVSGEKWTSCVELDGGSYQQGSAVTMWVTGSQRQPLGKCVPRDSGHGGQSACPPLCS